MDDLYQKALKLQEAQAIVLGAKITRRFSDEELIKELFECLEEALHRTFPHIP